MTKTEKAIAQMEAWAADDSHGYDQIYRWGEKGDYDCSAAVIQAWELAGVPVKTKGATYTGNMLSVFKKCGFKDITSSVNLSSGSGLVRGDVLLNTINHTAMYCGNGYEGEASINEKGTATGGTPGDQTGREFLKRSYRNFPWDYVLRYDEESGTTTPVNIVTSTGTAKITGVVDTVLEVQLWANRNHSAGLALDGLYGTATKAALTKILDSALSKLKGRNTLLRVGSTGNAVAALQALLVCNGYIDAYVDGDFGNSTRKALVAYQTDKKLEVDGMAGQETFNSLCE